MQQGLPLQHYTTMYSMQSNRQEPCDHVVHGQATIQQTQPTSAAEPQALSALKAPYHAALW